jgi:multidrug efflux pump subunit AcrA (membrane-fusion protein)
MHSIFRAVIGPACALLALVAVLSSLQVAFAAPMIESVGSAAVTLSLSPDPPQTGTARAVVAIGGASASTLDATSVSFTSEMPSMSMTGPSGQARKSGPGQWTFDLPIGMAAPWLVVLHLHGGINGSAMYRFAVSGDAANSAAIAGMTPSGNADGWRTATIALVVIIALVIGALVRRSKRSLALLAVSALVVVGFAFVQTQFLAANPTAAMNGLGDMGGMDNVHGTSATPVTLANVSFSGSAGARVVAPGSVAPYIVQDIVARVPGILRDFTSYAGDRIRRGDIIAHLDEPELGSQAVAAAADARSQAASAAAAAIEADHHAPNGVIVAQADLVASQSDLAAAIADVQAKSEQVRYWKTELSREELLATQGAVSQQEVTDERAQAAGADAALVVAQNKVSSVRAQVNAMGTKVDDARANIDLMQAQSRAAIAQSQRAAGTAQVQAISADYRTIVAPDDGVVVKRLVDPGTYVQAGTIIARIASIGKLRIQANVAQSDLPRISLGALLEARLANGKVVRGRVSSVTPVADSLSRTGSVEAIVDNPSPNLVPGGYVDVTIEGHSSAVAGAMLVPSAAIVGSADDSSVWADVNGTSHRVPVTIIHDDGSTATVTADDLTARSKIVVTGAGTLQEGQTIAEQRL